MGIEKLLITMMLPPVDGQVSRVENKPTPPSDSTNSSVNNIVNQTGGFG
jgi:hypothetical protein